MNVSLNPNMGRLDRGLRLTLAAAGVALLATGRVHGAARWAVGALAGVFAATSTAGHCPAYVPFDIDTRAAG